ncbi:MAG: NTP transferase domain-containing protein [Acidobacteria bacterium]|nr:NTP transferase domain-containing protein [Acidobacteriota bacterium]
MSKCAVVLAGGKGTRLRPFTISIPKPLMPVGEVPILEIIIRKLMKEGFRRIVLTVNHQAEIIQAFFGDGRKWGIRIEYSLEDKPLGTMGPLRLIKELPENFIILNGDVLTDLDLRKFLTFHVRGGHLFTIALHSRMQKIDYGVLETDFKGRLSGFREKPEIPYKVSMGIYAANRRILDFIPIGRLFGFDTLMLKLLKAGEEVHTRHHRGYWLDIGRPDDYEKAIRDFGGKK